MPVGLGDFTKGTGGQRARAPLQVLRPWSSSSSSTAALILYLIHSHFTSALLRFAWLMFCLLHNILITY